MDTKKKIPAGGFSLVELSIVLVILGLLTGGILAGQSLIRAAELRAVTTELAQYQVAIASFKDRYFAIPGDMRNAEAFWGTAGAGSNPGACPGLNSQPSTDKSTCNGDGNGIIFYRYEQFRFWQHLANAGLIEGSYTGVAGPGNALWDVDLGINAPPSKVKNAGWSVVSITYDIGANTTPAVAGDLSSNPQYIVNQLYFGAEATNHWTWAAAITPEEAWNIDTKIDDSRPGTGIAIGFPSNTCTDSANNDTVDANYQLTNSAIGCGFIFMPRATGL